MSQHWSGLGNDSASTGTPRPAPRQRTAVGVPGGAPRIRRRKHERRDEFEDEHVGGFATLLAWRAGTNQRPSSSTRASDSSVAVRVRGVLVWWLCSCSEDSDLYELEMADHGQVGVPQRPSGRDCEERPHSRRLTLTIQFRSTAVDAHRRAVSRIREERQSRVVDKPRNFGEPLDRFSRLRPNGEIVLPTTGTHERRT